MSKILIVLFFLCVNQIYGQVSKEDKTTQTKIITSRTIQSSNKSGFLSNQNFTKLNATNDGVSAEANISYVVGTWNLSVNASTPVTSKSQRVKPLTLAGLSSNSSLTIGVQNTVWGKGFNWNPTSFAQARKAIGKDTVETFKTKDLTEKEKARFYEIAGINWGTSFFYSAKVGIEQQEFKYVSNATTIEEADVSKTAFNASGSLGILNDNIGIFAVTFEHKYGYQADDPIKYYVPINNSGVQIEKNLSPNAPELQNLEKLRIEFLSIGKIKYDPEFDKIKRTPFRINPNINFEFNQKLFSFEFPLYFLTSNDERTNFNGGIYAGYVSDKDFKFNTDKKNFGFGVFIGANFSKLFE